EQGHRAAADRLQVAQDESARTERVSSTTPASLVLSKVRTHPRKHEAVTSAESAVLSRWSLADPPRVLKSIQAPHARFSDLAVAPSQPPRRLENRGGFFFLTTLYTICILPAYMSGFFKCGAPRRAAPELSGSSRRKGQDVPCHASPHMRTCRGSNDRGADGTR